MSNREEMDRLVARAKTEQTQRETDVIRACEVEQQHLIESERQRVERLRILLSTWLEAMVAAGHPNVSVVTVQSPLPPPEKVSLLKAFFGQRAPTEYRTEDYAGWAIFSAYSSNMYDDSSLLSMLYLLADGRLVQTSSYRVGSAEPTVSGVFTDLALAPEVKITEYLDRGRTRMEEEIVANLKKIAEIAGVDWSLPSPTDAAGA